MQRHGLALTVVLAVASTSVFAESDGKQLFQEISSEIAKYEAEHHLSNLMARIRETVEAAEIRSIEHHEYTITKYPDVFYDITGLEKGQHPYHATGDWDCAGEEDQAVIVQQPEAQVVVVLSSGATLTFETDADGIRSGAPHKDSTFAAKCGFVRAEHWGKSSVALVVDVGGKKLVAHQTSD